MIDSKLKEISHYERLKSKSKLGRYNIFWKALSQKVYVGDCSYLYRILKPESYQDFLDKYIAYTDPNPKKGLRKRKEYGRSIEELTELAKEYMLKVGNTDFTLEDYFDDIICHVIIETFDGHKPERELKSILIENGLDAIDTVGEIDSAMGVDIIVKKDGKVINYIQVKPITTFLSNSNLSLMADRANFYNKQDNLDRYIESLNNSDITKKETLYMLYDTDSLRNDGVVKWCYKDGKAKFHLSELADRSGRSLNTIKNFEIKPLLLK